MINGNCGLEFEKNPATQVAVLQRKKIYKLLIAMLSYSQVILCGDYYLSLRFLFGLYSTQIAIAAM